MNMPGMAAEASVYKTNNHYTSGRDFSKNLSTTVTPQDCGFGDFLECFGWEIAYGAICGVAIGACIGSGFDPVVCAFAASCVFGVGGIDLYLGCHDCLPSTITDAVDSTLRGGGRATTTRLHDDRLPAGIRVLRVHQSSAVHDASALRPTLPAVTCPALDRGRQR